MTLRLRDLTDDERTEVQRITRSHTLGAAFVRRARIVVHAMSGLKAEEIASRMDLCGNTVRYWLNRFNARGLKGLEEDVRTGRPPTYSAEQRSAVITAALTPPAELGLPFACWTLDRLVAYLSGLLHPRWEFVFQPKYAAYLNLIEPWWKVLRSLALKGRRFETWAEIEQAVERATAYWNQHKHPFIWGRRRRHRQARRLGVAALPAISLI